MTIDLTPSEIINMDAIKPYDLARQKIEEAVRVGKTLVVMTDRVYAVEKDGSRRLIHKMKSKDVRRFVRQQEG